MRSKIKRNLTAAPRQANSRLLFPISDKVSYVPRQSNCLYSDAVLPLNSSTWLHRYIIYYCSRIYQLFKFILIYNLYLNLHFYFYLRARPLWSILGLDFYFRNSTILVESPSNTDVNNFFSLFCTSSRRLSVLDCGEISNVSKNCRCCVVGSRSLKSFRGDNRVKYF